MTLYVIHIESKNDVQQQDSSEHLPNDPHRNARAHQIPIPTPRHNPTTPLAAKAPTRLDLQPRTRLLTQTRTNALRALQPDTRHRRDRRAAVRRTHRNALGAVG
jgi:hypothetical protein